MLNELLKSGRNILTTFPGLARAEGEFVAFLKTGQAKFDPDIARLDLKSRQVND